MNILEQAGEHGRQLADIYERLHMYPEIGLALPRTAQLVKDELTALGIPWREIMHCGIVAAVGAGERRILLRADMDALPLGELTGLPYASKHDGVMHACGHDMHTAMLLGAARLLKSREDTLGGQAVLMFQPGEEGWDGAKLMIEHGALEPAPQAAVALHVATSDEYPTGAAATMTGVIAAGRDTLVFDITGEGGHASEPENCVNPITVARRVLDAADDFLRAGLTPGTRLVFTASRFEAGTAANIIPQSCRVTATLRTMDETVRARVIDRLRALTRDVAAAYGAGGEMIVLSSLPVTKNDPAFTQQLHGMLSRDLDGLLLAPLGDFSSMGSEDFSYIARLVPSCYLYVISRSPEGRHYPVHSPKVEFDKDAIRYGAAIYAQSAISFLSSIEDNNGRGPVKCDE